jgi:hypothetical protein
MAAGKKEKKKRNCKENCAHGACNRAAQTQHAQDRIGQRESKKEK